MSTPPPPPGFEVLSKAKVDPWDILRAEGFTATNGYRTEGDVERIRRKGYKPATGGAHNRGDGVDLDHPKLPPKAQAVRLRQLAKQYGWDAKILDEGHHRHLAIKGWGAAPGTPGTPNSGLPPLPKDFTLEQRGSLAGGNFATGKAHDGDTFELRSGGNARVRGMDAYERSQTGRRSDGTVVPLGQDARETLLRGLTPATPVTFTGEQTYGRPVVTLGADGDDPAATVIREGHAVAVPSFLEGTPQFKRYMEAERLARQNLLGGHGTDAVTPAEHRKGITAEQVAAGRQSDVRFWDDRTPFAGLPPETEAAYLAFANDPKQAKTADDLIAWGDKHGFDVSREHADKFIAYRNEHPGHQAERADYLRAPRLKTDVGDGAAGAFIRGVADPVNMIDEVGGFLNTVTPLPDFDGPRENIWNSDRRFGDILWNNIDQNRAILQHDDEAHPVARFGGQLSGALAIPYGASARTAMQIARVGAVEGGLAGFGAGEGGVVDRLPNAAAGAALGGAGGYALGRIGNRIVKDWRAYRGAPNDTAEAAQHGVAEAAPIFNDGVQNAGPTPAAKGQPQGGATSAAMRMDDEGAELVGPVERQRDYINIAEPPPPPEGFVLEQPFGATRAAGERLSPEAMAKLAEGVEPQSVLPRPANAIEDAAEAERAHAGRFVELEAPDEFKHLPVKVVTTKNGGQVRVRGPLDLTQSLRLMGGIKDDGGELAHLGITNEGRRMDFGSNEQFLGKLIDNENGLSPDEATFRLWEEGYFPEFSERPTPAELIDRLKLEQMGERRFHPDQWEEVAAFEAAQADRFRIEQARDEGSPLIEDRGQLISLDDLEANTPPASVYEDAPRLTGKIGNINLDRLEKPGDVAQLIDQVSKRVGGFDAAARGRVTHEETKRLAVELGLKPEQLLARRQGQALNAEQAYAARALVQRSREAVVKLARKAVSGNDDEKLAFRKAWLKHVALEEQISGATAEAGRALSQFRMAATAADAGGEAVRAYLKGGGGKESIEGAAEAIIDLMEDPGRASHFMREAAKPKWRDKINELWINSLLSGPKTHVVNFVGNAVTTLMSLPEQGLTAGIGKVLRSHDRALIGEVGARVVGLADGAVEGLKRARHAFATGEPLDTISKVEASHYQAIGGTTGKIIRIPTRALTASDEFWKSVNASAELRALAYREAKRTTANPKDWQQKFEQLLRDPPEKMVTAAQNAARYYTFQKELGESGRHIQGWANKWPGAKIILPFVRTPINLLKYAGERSVFAPVMAEVRKALKAGGKARDEALAKITIGSGLSTAAVMAAMEGRVSGGGPADTRERAALLQSGWQPYSVRIGDQWVSYQRFDPFSTLFGAAADFTEVARYATSKEADEFAINLGMGIAKNLTSKTWLSGLSDAFEVLSDPERYGKFYFQRLAGSAAVPSVVNQAAQATDPYMRSARSIVDAIKARVPVLSESVPVRRDVWGEPVKRGESLGPDMASPIFTTPVSDDPVRQEIARLGVPLSQPPRYLKVRGKRFDLTPQQYDELVQLSGKPAKQYFDGFMLTDEWRQMPDHERVDLVQETLKEFRAAGREALKERHPEFGGGQRRGSPRAAPVDAPTPPPPGFVLQ